MLFGDSRTLDSKVYGWRPFPVTRKAKRPAGPMREPASGTLQQARANASACAEPITVTPCRLQGTRRSGRNLLIIGTDQVATDVRDYLVSLTGSEYRFHGFVANAEGVVTENPKSCSIVGDTNNVMALTRSMFIDELIFSSIPPADRLAALIEDARAHDITLRYIPTVSETLRNSDRIVYIGDLPTIVLHARKQRKVSHGMKRLIDIALATLALIVLCPLLAAIAIAIKLQSDGPVLYASDRVGRRGLIFTCYKFRTMVANADTLRQQLLHLNERSGVLFKMNNDPRVTSLGRILRKYSLDELPQLWNVLRGDMSLVGPRPCIQSELAHYQTSHFRRLDVVPGLTGLWQVEARHDPSFDSYIELDSKYVREWSVWLDLKIMFRTLNVIFRGTGV